MWIAARRSPSLLSNLGTPVASRIMNATLSPTSTLVTQRRDLHLLAAGSLKAFNDPAAAENLSEPTMVSTIESRHDALKLNPQLFHAEQNLAQRGHHVQYGIDATQLHNEDNQSIREMNAIAKKHGVDMQKIEVHYLRSLSENPEDDKNLIKSVLESSRKSGVHTVTAVHSLNKFNQKSYAAPSEATWGAAAAETGFVPQSFGEIQHKPTVESVPRNDGANSQTIRVLKSGKSTFTT